MGHSSALGALSGRFRGAPRPVSWTRMIAIRYTGPMRATLTLDDDVTALLDLARQKQGRSLEEVANELLRRTLRHLGIQAGSALKDSGMREPPAALSLTAKIDELYNELGALRARSVKDPGVESDIEHKREQLHALQVEEAAAWRSQAEAHRHLKPGEGRQILERAEQLLER